MKRSARHAPQLRERLVGNEGEIDRFSLRHRSAAFNDHRGVCSAVHDVLEFHFVALFEHRPLPGEHLVKRCLRIPAPQSGRGIHVGNFFQQGLVVIAVPGFIQLTMSCYQLPARMSDPRGTSIGRCDQRLFCDGQCHVLRRAARCLISPFTFHSHVGRVNVSTVMLEIWSKSARLSIYHRAGLTEAKDCHASDANG